LFITGFQVARVETGLYQVQFRSPYGTGYVTPGLIVSSPFNYAPAGTTTMSSISGNLNNLYSGIRAVDLNLTGSAANYGIALTAKDLNPWWELDLKYPTHTINRLRIYNRSDADKTGLNNVIITVMDNGRRHQFNSGLYTGVGDAGFPNLMREITFPQTTGTRYIRVALTGNANRQMGLAEVEVY
jgi:hypothetical protein